jgi:hypothetical protein
MGTLVQDGTRIFGSDGTELDSSALVVDRVARIDGVVQLSDTEADTLRAALIVIDQGAPAETVFRGDILTIDAEHRSFNVSTDGGDRCVRVPQDAAIFLVTTSDAGFTSERGEFSDLLVGAHADAFGTLADDGCLLADTVIADASV